MSKYEGLRPPLDRVTLTQVHIRVVYQLVRLDYKRTPRAYGAFPALAIQRVADALQRDGFGGLAAYAKAASRHVAGGISMARWRDSEPTNWQRSVFKQRWR